MNPLYVSTAFGFVLLTALFFGLVLRHLRIALAQTAWPVEKQKTIQARTMIVFLLWGVFLAVFSLAGISRRFEWFPLNLAPVLFIPLITTLVVVFSGKMKHILTFVPQKTLTQLQVFRVFVEILLWMLFLENLLPVQMTFEGRNFDILAGVTAPIVAYWFSENRKVMIVWNFLCLALLINIVTIAILSTPTSIRVFYNEPSNTIVTYFPFIFLPGFLVPLAYGLHFLSLRKLLMG
jgi:hypothetical protein